MATQHVDGLGGFAHEERGVKESEGMLLGVASLWVASLPVTGSHLKIDIQFRNFDQFFFSCPFLHLQI